MQILVEFFGIPRARAGAAKAHIPCGDAAMPLSAVLAALSEQFPDFAADCLDGRSLRPGFIANLDGQRFVRDPWALVTPGQTVLLMSADAGG